MTQPIRVIVVNTDTAAGPELRAFLLSVEGVKIVAEVRDPAELDRALSQIPAEVLLLHLDPSPESIMHVAAPLIEGRKDRLAAIAMTESRDAELVVQAMRAGMREFLWKPFNPEQLAEVLHRVGAELRHRMARSGAAAGKLVSVVGTVGGVGATQFAVNLAAELAQIEQANEAKTNGNGEIKAPPPYAGPVAVVDLDFHFGQVATYMDTQPAYTIAELCESTEQIETQMLERAMQQHSTGVHVLARPTHFVQAEAIPPGPVASLLSTLQEHYRYVVVDGLRRMDGVARSVFQMTDVNLLVLQLMVPSVRNTDRILQELRQMGFNMDRARLVCNRFGRDTGSLEASDVENSLGRKIDWYLPDDWKTASAAVNMGTPLCLQASKSKLRLAYRQIAAALAAPQGVEGEASGGEPAKRKLFSIFAGA